MEQKFQFPAGYKGWEFDGIEVGKEITVEWEGAFWGTAQFKYYTVFKLVHSNGNYFFNLAPQHNDFFHFIRDLNNNYCVYNWAHPSNIQIGEDAKLTITWDGQSLKFYVNGLLVSSGSASSSCDLSGTKILYLDSGTDSKDFSYHKNLRIYNRVLSDDEIKQNVANWKNPIREGLIFWVDANDISWGVWKDRIQGISGSWIGKDKINGYGVVRNFDSDINHKTIVGGSISYKDYDINKYLVDGFTYEYIIDRDFRNKSIMVNSLGWGNNQIILRYYNNTGLINEVYISSSYNNVLRLYLLPLFRIWDGEGNVVSSRHEYIYPDLEYGWSYHSVSIPFHLQSVINDNYNKLYVNGKMYQNLEDAMWINKENNYQYVELSVTMFGMKEFRIYNRELSEEELNYNLRNNDNPIKDGLIWWIKFDSNHIIWDNDNNNWKVIPIIGKENLYIDNAVHCLVCSQVKSKIGVIEE